MKKSMRASPKVIGSALSLLLVLLGASCAPKATHATAPSSADARSRASKECLGAKLEQVAPCFASLPLLPGEPVECAYLVETPAGKTVWMDQPDQPMAARRHEEPDGVPFADDAIATPKLVKDYLNESCPRLWECREGDTAADWISRKLPEAIAGSAKHPVSGTLFGAEDVTVEGRLVATGRACLRELAELRVTGRRRAEGERQLIEETERKVKE